MGATGFFSNASGFQQPVGWSCHKLVLEHGIGRCLTDISLFLQPQYHQYAPIGPYSQNAQSYQRNVHDLFISNDLREEIQKKAAATLQTIPNLHLPTHVENYHSLVPLDTNQKGSLILGGYSSWIYKAQSSTTGRYFALRRIEGMSRDTVVDDCRFVC